VLTGRATGYDIGRANYVRNLIEPRGSDAVSCEEEVVEGSQRKPEQHGIRSSPRSGSAVQLFRVGRVLTGRRLGQSAHCRVRRDLMSQPRHANGHLR
jgi:hypothetical protein